MGKAGRKRVNERRLRIRVAEGQGRYDGGEMGGVTERNLVVGDWVRTKNWEKSKKGLSRWSVPKRITKVSKYSAVVDDGRKWNVGSVVKCNELEIRKWKNVACEHGEQGEEGRKTVLEEKKKRMVKRPDYLRDYIA
ncbi:hypothetical protein NDU88_006749 [Pleurodeles waltl]|uniref:Uncharacterized protein n=1 Tax=Pleurodeles waltl TaxID=8319 RepID=A0AAV7X1K1_PLEWA|nr:hypothetical protein NDU88_006749 [Pleurodeles waltl]